MADEVQPEKKQIVLAHGGGGELTRRLLEEQILPRLGNDLLNPLDDSAMLPKCEGRTCFTTDAFVVQPLEFPGGDIGRLAVCGTVNDLAVMGARPKALSLALIIEEGLPMDLLDRCLDSIARAAKEAGVAIVTGDTKVIERSRGDGLFITTAGVGELRDDLRLDEKRIEAGDCLLVSGSLAEHGLCIMAAREELRMDSRLESDAAPLNGLIEAILDTGADVKFLRDPTRGGAAGVIADLVESTGLSLEIEEEALPIPRAVRHAAELLGLDPLTIANEGKVMIVTSETDTDRVLKACRNHPLGKAAAKIGVVPEPGVKPSKPALAEMITTIGGRRIIQRPYGEDLPRIC